MDHPDLVDYSGVDLARDPKSVQVQRRALAASVRFAKFPEMIDTLEGVAPCAAGDAVVTGGAGEEWPVRRARFFETYRAAKGVAMGEDGVYERIPSSAYAFCAQQPFKVVIATGAALYGEKGDWLVQSDDYSVVRGDLFDMLYERGESGPAIL